MAMKPVPLLAALGLLVGLAGTGFHLAQGPPPGVDGLERQAAFATGLRRAALLTEAAEKVVEADPGKAILLANQAQPSADPALRPRVLNVLAKAYINRSDNDTALGYANKAVKAARETADTVQLAHAHLNITLAYLNNSRWDLAMESCDQASQLAEQLGNPVLRAMKENLYGCIYANFGDYEKAVEHSLRAINLFTACGNLREMASAHNNLGIVYFKAKDWEKALRHYGEALGVARRNGDRRLVSNILNNLGVLYYEQDDYEKALQYYLQSLDLERALESELGVAIALGNIGGVYEKQGLKEKALAAYRESLAVSRKKDDRWGVANNLLTIGRVLGSKGQFAAALASAKEGLAEAEAIKSKELESDGFETLSGIYEAAGDYRNALDSFKSYWKKEQEVFNEETRKRMGDLRTQYEISRRAGEIELLKKDSAILSLEVSRGHVLHTGLLSGLVMAAGLVFLLFNRNRLKARANADIQRKNEELRDAYQKLEEAARTDPLTRLSNRRHVMELAQAESFRFERSHRPFCVVLGDIDHFKAVNDTYGHDAGDFVLSSVSTLMRTELRKQDAVGRWGGEEFLWILPETGEEGALKVAERVRQRIETSPLAYDGKTLRITMTFGVACYDAESGFEDCVRQADAALYRGKEGGRNRVVLADPVAHEPTAPGPETGGHSRGEN